MKNIIIFIIIFLVSCSKDDNILTINKKTLPLNYYKGKTSYELKTPYSDFIFVESIRGLLGISSKGRWDGGNNLGFVYVDINNDGYEDIFYPYQSSDASTYLKPDLIINKDNQNYIIDNSYLPNDYIGNLDTRKSCVGDFNNDGLADILMSNANFEGQGPSDKTKDVTAVILMSDNLSNKFKLKRLDILGNKPHHAMASGDLNGDGNIDIIAGGGQDTTYILYGNGNGEFEKTITNKVNSAHLTFEILDVNKDGKNDIIVAGEEQTPNAPTGPINYTKIIWNDGNVTNLPPSNDIYSLVVDIACEDIDNDGKKEIILDRTPGGNTNSFYKGSQITIYKTNDYLSYSNFKQINVSDINWMTHIWVFKKNNEWILNGRLANRAFYTTKL